MADLQGIFSHNYGEIVIRDNLSRDQYLYVAKLAYRIQRHDVVLKIMIKVIQKWRPINAVERDMFNRCAIGFCNKLLEDYRNFCRNVVGDDDNLELTRYYKFEMEMDLRRFCCDMIDVLMSHLVPFASAIEEEVDYLQLKGTFHHMIARLDARIGETTFQSAQSLADDHLDAANLVRLETSRAYSEFSDDISQDRERAIAISRTALSEARASLELRNEQASNETAAVIADLQANLNLWTLRPGQFIQNLDAGDISGRNAAGAA